MSRKNCDCRKMFRKALQVGAEKREQSLANIVGRLPEQEKLIILIDIVGFSKSSTKEQMANLLFFQFFLKRYVLTSRFSHRNKLKIQKFIPTGDGCYIVAKKCESEIAVRFLITMISLFKMIQENFIEKSSLRVSALIGECLVFKDLSGHLNFIGDGMNEAERIMSCGRKSLEESGSSSENSLFAGVSLSAELKKNSEKCEKYCEFSGLSDKHGKKRDVFVLSQIK